MIIFVLYVFSLLIVQGIVDLRLSALGQELAAALCCYLLRQQGRGDAERNGCGEAEVLLPICRTDGSRKRLHGTPYGPLVVLHSLFLVYKYARFVCMSLDIVHVWY